MPQTRLVSCGDEACLRIEGRRPDPALIVAINGRAMAVSGATGWSLTIPVDTIRQLAGYGASTIEVSLRHPVTRRETLAVARLPIGLLGDSSALGSIRVTAS